MPGRLRSGGVLVNARPRARAGIAPLALIAGAAGLGCGDAPATERARVAPAVADTSTAGARATPGVDMLCVDTERSLVGWRGTEAVGSGHAGIVRLADGHLVLRDSAVVGGEFTVDMRTIEVTDIPPHEVEARRLLRSHLMHEEFFAVDRFPSAGFVLTDIAGGEHGAYTVSGNLAVRDSVHNVTFEATAPVVGPRELWATARFSIDRQLWGVSFDGATSTLRDAIVDDDIQLELTVVASAAEEEEGGPCGVASGLLWERS
ncbi:MAG: YceI family protein [Gemmatimonadota bacterium]